MKTLCLFIALFLVIIPNLDHASAESKIIRKTVKKIVTPEIAPVAPPEVGNSNEETKAILPSPPPPPSSVYGIKALKQDPGLLGWGRPSELGASYQYTRGQQGFLGVFAAKGDLVFEDPLYLGTKVGLAEDAFEYKVGLGLVLGQDVDQDWMFSIPLSLDSVVYFNEGSLGGMTPFFGSGLNLNLLGTDLQMGGLGFQLYGGVLADFGFSTGKTRLAVGYNSLKVGTARLAEGLYFSVGQPIVL